MCALDPPGGFTSPLPLVVTATPDTLASQIRACRRGGTVQLTTGVYTGTHTAVSANVTVEPAPGHDPWNFGTITAATVTGLDRPTEVTVEDDATMQAMAGIDSVTINLNGGTYSSVILTGDNVTVRSAPGCLATFAHAQNDDQPTFTVAGANVTLEDLTIVNTNTDRYDPVGGSHGFRGDSLVQSADNLIVRRCILADAGNGITSYDGSEGLTVEDCLILDTGWNASDRGHGHGIYTQNNVADAAKVVRRTVIARPHSTCFKPAGTGSNIHHYIAEDVVMLGNEHAGVADSCWNHYSVNGNSTDHTLTRCWFWNPRHFAAHSGYQQDEGVVHSGLVIDDCFSYAKGGVVLDRVWDDVTITDSDFVLVGTDDGSIVAKAIAEGNATDTTTLPTTRAYSGNRVETGVASPFRAQRSSKTLAEFQTMTGETVGSLATIPARTLVAATEEGGALIAVYNPSEAATVDVSTALSGEWWLYDALNPLAGPVASGSGATVTVPMTGLTCRTPVGLDAADHPAPLLGVFVARLDSEWVAGI